MTDAHSDGSQLRVGSFIGTSMRTSNQKSRQSVTLNRRQIVRAKKSAYCCRTAVPITTRALSTPTKMIVLLFTTYARKLNVVDGVVEVVNCNAFPCAPPNVPSPCSVSRPFTGMPVKIFPSPNSVKSNTPPEMLFELALDTGITPTKSSSNPLAKFTPLQLMA